MKKEEEKKKRMKVGKTVYESSWRLEVDSVCVYVCVQKNVLMNDDAIIMDLIDLHNTK